MSTNGKNSKKKDPQTLEGHYVPKEKYAPLTLNEQFNKRVFRYQYTLGHMNTFISLILEALSIRSIKRILSFFESLLPTQLKKIPSWYSGRLWLLKLGYYKLIHATVHSDEWIWVIDHATQWGVQKCFVVLGIKVSQIPVDRALKLSDVKVLMVSPGKTSNGNIVLKKLESLALEIGVPRAVIADAGSDIKSGIEQFCRLTRGTVYLYDIKHMVANLLKSEFEKDKAWNDFLDLATKTRKFIQQSAIAGLAPPSLRIKARFMNLAPLIAWGVKTLNRLDSDQYPKTVDVRQAEIKLGWLPFFREDLLSWNRILNKAVMAEKIVREAGYHIGVTSQVDQKLNFTDTCPRSKSFQAKMIDAIFRQESKLKLNDHFISSSEILESLFGKYKYLQSQQAKSGFTVSVLALSAMTGETTPEIIQRAMASTTVKQVNNWGAENIGVSVQAQRTAWIANEQKEQKRDEKVAA